MTAGFTRIELRPTEIPEIDLEIRGFLEPPAADIPESFDAAARRYLEVMFTQPATESFGHAQMMLNAIPFQPTAAEVGPALELRLPELEYHGTEELELTDSFVAAYTQTYRDVPIHGSTIGVERLNFSVRDGKRWDPFAMASEENQCCKRAAPGFGALGGERKRNQCR